MEERLTRRCSPSTRLDAIPAVSLHAASRDNGPRRLIIRSIIDCSRRPNRNRNVSRAARSLVEAGGSRNAEFRAHRAVSFAPRALRTVPLPFVGTASVPLRAVPLKSAVSVSARFYSQAAQIKVGERIPADIKVRHITRNEDEKDVCRQLSGGKTAELDTDKLFKGKTVVVVSVPGPYTPVG